MVQPPCLIALQELQTFPDLARQVDCLRRLKNDIVGHGLRKQLVVRNGLLRSLQQVLSVKSGGASTGDVENEVRLQATLIVGSLAEGGPAFYDALLASDVVPSLLQGLDPEQFHLDIAFATTQTLYSIARAWKAIEFTCPTVQSHFVALLYSRQNIAHLRTTLQPASPSQLGYRLVTSVAQLIALTCVTDEHRRSLVKGGILEALATQLADFSALDPAKRCLTTRYHDALFNSILEATASVVEGSRYRTHRLVLSPPCKRAFKTREERDYDLGQRVESSTNIPHVPAPTQKPSSSSFPTLSSRHPRHDPNTAHGHDGSAFITWLISRARRTSSIACRLAALHLLARINPVLESQGLTRARVRERVLALLAVPLVVRIIQDLSSQEDEDRTEHQAKACNVLADLIRHSQELQTAAVDAGAIKRVCQIFRKTFDQRTIPKPMWAAATSEESTDPTCRLGDVGLPGPIANAMECRASALRALSAITHRDDLHRKAVIDQGIISNVIDSLSPYPETQSPSSADLKDGNTKSVLIAACQMAAALSRSVSLLRTSLIDSGIAKPILLLLQNPDNEVQVAATDVTCNFVLEFSPMRQDLMEHGTLQTLCDQAKRSSPSLRLSSLWALKHLVLNAPKEIKIEALEELGTGWLVQALNGRPPSGMSTSNAAGEQVDILNVVPEMDVDSEEDPKDDDGEILYDQGTPYQSSAVRSTLTSDVSWLEALRVLEQSLSMRVVNEDMQIQEQAMDFVRNFINADDAAAMVDHINAVIGLERIFEILRDKFTSGTHATDGHAHDLSPRIVYAAVHILNHISAASSRHKQLLISQKPLLKAWLPHLSGHDRDTRVSCVWTVINLTWVDDLRDRDDARQRARELRSIGIEEKIRALATDPDLDVRERVKTAIRQMDELLSHR